MAWRRCTGESFRKAGLQSAHFAMKSVQSREMLNPIVQTLTAMGPSAVLLYAVATNSNLDTVVAFITALFAFGASVKKISTLGVYFLQMSLAMERLLGLFAMKPSVKEAENPVALPGFTRALEFRNVDFSYGDAPVLQEVSFTLRRGQRLGLAGENGSGKSSLLNLLFRFYDPTDGEILLDGIPLTELRLSDLRFQLALGQPGHPALQRHRGREHRGGQARRQPGGDHHRGQGGHAHNFITELPKGYDTPLGERGLRLSGGQRQRISIARAFVRNAPILVLDEATAALDAQSEAEVQKAIDHLAEHRTVICVAHRLSTLRTMDQILVLSQGRVVEQGNFEQLLALGGIFTAMAARQSIHPLSPAPV
ncbi:MAG: ABC transporter ATP-binding protein [Verrucomicrobiota bacterium]